MHDNQNIPLHMRHGAPYDWTRDGEFPLDHGAWREACRRHQAALRDTSEFDALTDDGKTIAEEAHDSTVALGIALIAGFVFAVIAAALIIYLAV